MILVRGIGCIFLIPTVLVLSYGVLLWHGGVPLFELAARDYLAMNGSSGPDVLQVAVQRALPGLLSDPRVAPLLMWPIAAVLGLVAGVLAVPGTVILVLFRPGWSRALVRQQYGR